MVNQEVRTPVLLEGAGFVARKNRDYRPGEYRRLSNVELDKGRLVGRKNILGSYVDSDTEDPALGIDEVFSGAIGHYGYWTIYCDKIRQYAYSSSGSRVRMFDLTSVGVGMSYSKVVSFFEYNNKCYWLYVNANDLYIKYNLYSCKSSPTKSPESLGNASFPISKEATIEIGNTDPLYRGFKFNNTLTYKERFWICNSEIIYFSKPTDPAKFDVVDGGGFFKLQGETINYLIDGGNVLYVLCESSVYVISYNTDPNTDAVVTKLTGNTGGMHGCLFRGDVYFINTEGIYVINNNTISKVMDSNLDEGVNDYTKQTLTSYNDYIIINKTYLKSLTGISRPELSSDTTVVYNYINTNDVTLPGPPFYHSATYNGVPLSIVEATYGPGFNFMNTNRVEFKNGTNVFTLQTNRKIEVNSGVDYTFNSFLVATPVKGSTSYPNVTGTINIIAYDSSGYIVSDGIIYKNSNIFGWDGNDSQSQRVNVYFECTPSVETVIVQIEANITKTNSIQTDMMFSASFPFLYEGRYDISTAVLYGLSNNNMYTYSTEVRSWGTIVKREGLPAFFYYYLDLVPWMPKNTISGNVLGYNTYALNMDTGSMSVIDFKPYLDKDTSEFSGYIYDVSYNPNVDPTTGITSLMLATSDLYDDISVGDAGKSYVFFMAPEDNNVQDVIIVDEGGVKTSRSIKPRYEIEVDAFTPDATEYLVKKFRSFELMGTLPSTDFEISFAYNDNDYGTSIQLIDDKSDLPNSRAHYPHRIGVNQRAQSIGIKMESTNLKDIQDPGIVNSYDFLEISDMEMLWTYTQRDQKYSSYSNKT